jgi:hypothetical protein
MSCDLDFEMSLFDLEAMQAQATTLYVEIHSLGKKDQ